METYTDQDLINELLALSPNYPPRHGGVTAREWAEAKGIHMRNAYEKLDRWVEDGILVVELNTVGDNRRPIRVYYKKTEQTP